MDAVIASASLAAAAGKLAVFEILSIDLTGISFLPLETAVGGEVGLCLDAALDVLRCLNTSGS
jgi:hypothetical protein